MKESMKYGISYLEVLKVVNFLLYIFYHNKNQAKAGLAILMLDKVDFWLFSDSP